jgi:hypothetical protein
MALTLAQHKFADAGASPTQTVTVTSTTAGSLLVVCEGNGSSRTVTGVTDGGDTFTQATSAAGSNGVDFSDAWYCLSGAGGKTSVVVTLSGNAAECFVEVFEVTGFSTASFDLANNIAGAASANTATGAAVTTTSTTGFVGAIEYSSNIGISANPKAGNEFTSGGDITGNNNAACSLISSTAASHTPVWTSVQATGAFVSTTVAFKEAGGGVSGASTRMLLLGVGI